HLELCLCGPVASQNDAFREHDRTGDLELARGEQYHVANPASVYGVLDTSSRVLDAMSECGGAHGSADECSIGNTVGDARVPNSLTVGRDGGDGVSPTNQSKEEEQTHAN